MPYPNIRQAVAIILLTAFAVLLICSVLEDIICERHDVGVCKYAREIDAHVWEILEAAAHKVPVVTPGG